MDKDILNKTIEILDSVSPTFCTAKWLQPTLNLNTGTAASCCLGTFHPIKAEGIKDEPHRLVNPEAVYQDRKELLTGVKSKSCMVCLKIGAFDKTEPNERIYRSSEDWSHNELHRIEEAGATKPVVPSSLEVTFNNKCQFKCLYCEAPTSSAIMDETNKFGPLPIETQSNSKSYWDKRSFTFYDDDSNPYKDAFWDWFLEHSKELYIFRITGGEPLLSEDTFKVLEFFEQNPHPNLKLVINTNLGVSKSFLDKFAERLKNLGKDNLKEITIVTSVDTYGKDAEFVRYGLKWDVFVKNTEFLLLNFPNINMSITSTFTIFSIFNFPKLITEVERLKSLRPSRPIHLSTYPLIVPMHLGIQYLKDYFQDEFELIRQTLNNSNLTDFEKDLIKRSINVYGDDDENDYHRGYMIAQFYWHITEIERRRKVDMLSYHPQLKEFYSRAKESSEYIINYWLDCIERNQFIHEGQIELLFNFLRVTKYNNPTFEELFRKRYGDVKNIKAKIFFMLNPNGARLPHSYKHIWNQCLKEYTQYV